MSSSISGTVQAQNSGLSGSASNISKITGTPSSQDSTASGQLSVPFVIISGSVQSKYSTSQGRVFSEVLRISGNFQTQESSSSGSVSVLSSISGTVQSENSNVDGKVGDLDANISGSVKAQNSSISSSISVVTKITGTSSSGKGSVSGKIRIVVSTPERDMTSDVKNEALANTQKVILMVELLYDSSPLRLWTGYGDLNHFNTVFQGVGNFLGVSEINETEEIKAAKVKLTLNGIPSGLISDALSKDIRGRPATIWLGFLDSNDDVIDDPIEIFKGEMDNQEITETGRTSTISVSIESDLADLFRQRELRYTKESHQLLHPDDTFFNFQAALQDADIPWGKEETPSNINKTPQQ